MAVFNRTEPESGSNKMIKLIKFFSNEDNIIYPIQSDLQRRYCWPSQYVTNFFTNFIIDIYELNVEADKSGEDPYWAVVGEGILTKPEENYGPKNKCRKQEIIDLSQRITSSMAIISVLLYVFLENEEIFDIEERRKIFHSYLRTKNGESWKVVSTFKDSDIDETLEALINRSFKTDIKSLNASTKCFKDSNVKKNEVKYKSFNSICSFIYKLIDNTIGLKDSAIKKRLDLFLKMVSVDIKECDKKDRVANFMAANTFRLGVPNKDIYKGLLCSKGEKIDSKFQDFEEKISEITGKNKKIHIIKTPVTEAEYILKLGLIILDKTRKTCKFGFSLEDEKDGLEFQLNQGFLKTEENVIEYLDVCIDIINFLKNSMTFSQKDFYNDWYLFSENHTKPFIWLYNILPSYVISNLKDEIKKEYAFIVLLKSFTTYSIKYSSNRSVQYIQPYMYSLSKEILKMANDKYSVEDFKNGLNCLYAKTFGEYIKNDLSRDIKRLAYSRTSDKGGIYSILSFIEYMSQIKCGIKRNNLFKLVEKNQIEIDHIMPQSKKSQDNEEYIDSIGNLAFLEKTLNGSKNDDGDSTSKRYSDSSFISTKLIVQGNRYEGLKNEEIKGLQENIIPYTATENNVNQFDVSQINERKNRIAYEIRNVLSCDEVLVAETTYI